MRAPHLYAVKAKEVQETPKGLPKPESTIKIPLQCQPLISVTMACECQWLYHDPQPVVVPQTIR